MSEKERAQRAAEAALAERERKAAIVWDDLEDTGEDLKELAKSSKVFTKKAKEAAALAKGNTEKQEALKRDDSDVVAALAQLKQRIKNLQEQNGVNAPTVDQELNSVDKLRILLDSVKGKDNIVSFRKALLKASGLMGAKDRMRKVLGAIKDAPGKAYAKAVDKALQLAGNNKTAVTVVKSIDNVARSVKLVGVESIKWIGKKILGLGRTLWRFLKAPAKMLGGTGNLLKSLIGAAALYPYISEAVKSVNKALEEKYGEHYIRNFMQDTWKAAWEKAEEGFNWLKEAGGKIVEDVSKYLGDSWKWLETKVGELTESVKLVFTESWEKLSTTMNSIVDGVGKKVSELREWVGTRFDDMLKTIKGWLPNWMTKDKKGDGMGNSMPENPTLAQANTNVQAKLNAYTSYKGTTKTLAKTNLENVLKEQTPDGSIEPGLAAELVKQGFVVPPNKIKSAATAQEQAAKAIPSQTNISVTPTTATPAKEGVSTGAGMAAAAPVTATPPAPAASTTAEGEQRGGKFNQMRGSGGTPGARQVPTSVGDDTLAVKNLVTGLPM